MKSHTWYLFTFLLAVTTSLLMTRWMRSLAIRIGMVDIPDGGRRRHAQPTPRAGGVPLFLAAVFTITVTAVLMPDSLWRDSLHWDVDFRIVALGAFATLLIGLWDDIAQLKARTKLALEIALACALFAGGLRIEVLNVLSAPLYFTDAAALVITVLWIVGVTNAFNLIDGSDGVSAGAALFASFAIAFVAVTNGSPIGAVLALVIAGATLGFLFFNFPPATIFLGDSGSLFLGYCMAALGIVTAQKASTMLAVAIPVVSCGLPILDILLTAFRRFLRNQPLFLADRGHIHHRLQDLGHSPRSVALWLMAVSASFALLSLLLVQPKGGMVGAAFIITGVIVLVAIQRLRIPELLELQRIFDRSLQQRRVIASNTRLRESVVLLETVHSVPGIEAALRHAFEKAEFEVVELSLWDGPAPVLLRLSRESDWTSSVRDEQVIEIQRENRQKGPPRPAGWEICLPFRNSIGEISGSLTLWSSSPTGHVLTDLGLVARDLQPALKSAYQRAVGVREVQLDVQPVALRSAIAP